MRMIWRLLKEFVTGRNVTFNVNDVKIEEEKFTLIGVGIAQWYSSELQDR
jgi:hypothetical protein